MLGWYAYMHRRRGCVILGGSQATPPAGEMTYLLDLVHFNGIERE